MLMFTLVISCLTASNLSGFMDLIFQFPVQYCLYSIGLCFHHQSHPQLGIISALALSLYSFWSYFSTLLQWQVGHLWTWSVHLSVSYPSAFSCCSWSSQGKINKWFGEVETVRYWNDELNKVKSGLKPVSVCCLQLPVGSCLQPSSTAVSCP